MTTRIIIVLLIIVAIGGGVIFLSSRNNQPISVTQNPTTNTSSEVSQQAQINTHPLSIEQMRLKEYPGSEIVIEQTLASRPTYDQFIASYQSDGLKQYGLLTIPKGDPSTSSVWPAIVFNHGFIAPETYVTTQKYESYVDYFARNGYVVFKIDYRGHGNSEGEANGGHYLPDYTNDVLNAISSLEKHKSVNPQKIGLWGHSMGGHLTIRAMVVEDDIDCGVVWAGVVGTYPQILDRRNRSYTWQPSGRQELLEKYGSPSANPKFWEEISPLYYLKDISGPIQIHHGLRDDSVPVEFSRTLKDFLEKAGKVVEYYEYPNGDHNLSGASFSPAMSRSLEFFDKCLKN